MRFHVRALTADNRVEEYELEAGDEAAARRVVLERGGEALALRPASTWRLSAQRATSFPLLLWAQELLALLRAGLSLVESIEALSQKQMNSVHRAVLAQLHEDLRQGQRFSAALKAHGKTFPLLFIGLMQAAEGTSDLPRALARYIDYQQSVDYVRHKLISAAIYPIILLGVGGAVVMFLMGYVVPKFAMVYRGTGREMPWASQVMLEVGRGVAEHPGAVALTVCVAFAFAAISAWRLAQTGKWFDLISKLPGFGEQVRLFVLSRQYMTLGLLLQGGISIVPALSTVAGSAVGPLRIALERVSEKVQQGQPLSDAFESEHLTTPISLRLVRVGEKTGDLGAMLRQAAEFYDGDTARFIERFTRAVEPVMMAAIGILVGAIVLMLYMPIFDLAGSLG